MSELSNIIVGGVLVASKDLVNKLLGPTASYLGDKILVSTQKLTESLDRIFRIAIEKTGPQIDRDEAANARILKGVCDEGRFIDDVVAAEYFGGVLAASRSKDGSDDSGLPSLALIKTLSVAQLRLHFILYSIVNICGHQRRSRGEDWNWGRSRISITANDLFHVMNVAGPDGQSSVAIAAEGLVDADLIHVEMSYRLSELRHKDYAAQDKDDYLAFTPTERGAVLFLRALGQKGLNADLITSIVATDCLSSELKSSLRIPDDFSVNEFEGSPETHLNLINSVRDDLESQIDDLVSELEEVRSQLDDDEGPQPPQKAKP